MLIKNPQCDILTMGGSGFVSLHAVHQLWRHSVRKYPGDDAIFQGGVKYMSKWMPEAVPGEGLECKGI